MIGRSHDRLCVSVQGVVYPSDELNKEVGRNRQPRVNAFVPPHLLPWVTTYTNPGDERERKENKDVCGNQSLNRLRGSLLAYDT